MNNYLAFDLGASSGKLHLGRFDGSRLALEPVHRFDNQAIPLGHSLYWDFLHIWSNLGRGLQMAWQQSGGDLVSLGMDSFCNDFSFVDKSGDLLSPVRCYRDNRTARCQEAIYNRMSPEKLYAISGNQTALFNTLMQLASMREEGKDAVLDAAHKLLFVPDLLGFYLTGEMVTEYTLASVSQLYEYAGGDWSQEILDAFSIPRSLFAPIVPPGAIAGRIRQQYQKDNNVGGLDVVSVCEHDTASAFLGSACAQRCAIISSGTWSLVGAETEAPRITEYGFTHNIANEGSVEGHHRMIRNVMGSWLLQQVRQEYRLEGESYPFDRLSQMARREPPFVHLIDVDNDLFFQPGHMREKIRRECLAQYGGAPETPGQFTRCIIESLAMKYRWAVEKLETVIGCSLPVVSVIGGGSQDALACQFTANACRRPVQAGPADASALGNILVQMLAHGEIGGIRQGRQLLRESFPTREYLPRDGVLWEEAYQSYKSRYGLD